MYELEQLHVLLLIHSMLSVLYLQLPPVVRFLVEASIALSTIVQSVESADDAAVMKVGKRVTVRG